MGAVHGLSTAGNAIREPEMTADRRPVSAVSTGVGVAGLAGLAIWMIVARYFHMYGPFSAVVAVLACGVPMAGWSVVVDRVH
jgi:hypothetical protein